MSLKEHTLEVCCFFFFYKDYILIQVIDLALGKFTWQNYSEIILRIIDFTVWRNIEWWLFHTPFSPIKLSDKIRIQFIIIINTYTAGILDSVLNSFMYSLLIICHNFLITQEWSLLSLFRWVLLCMAKFISQWVIKHPVHNRQFRLHGNLVVHG